MWTDEQIYPARRAFAHPWVERMSGEATLGRHLQHSRSEPQEPSAFTSSLSHLPLAQLVLCFYCLHAFSCVFSDCLRLQLAPLADVEAAPDFSSRWAGLDQSSRDHLVISSPFPLCDCFSRVSRRSSLCHPNATCRLSSISQLVWGHFSFLGSIHTSEVCLYAYLLTHTRTRAQQSTDVSLLPHAITHRPLPLGVELPRGLPSFFSPCCPQPIHTRACAHIYYLFSINASVSGERGAVRDA